MLKRIYYCSCNYQTQYECGGLGIARCEYAPVNPIIRVALCDSRHDIPQAVNGSIFPETIENPMDFDGMAEYVNRVLEPCRSCHTLHVYVTGLTPALLTVINWCHAYGVSCVTWHYDRETGAYKHLIMD